MMDWHEIISLMRAGSLSDGMLAHFYAGAAAGDDAMRITSTRHPCQLLAESRSAAGYEAAIGAMHADAVLK